MCLNGKNNEMSQMKFHLRKSSVDSCRQGDCVMSLVKQQQV